MKTKNKFIEQAEKIVSGDYERMKCNFEEIFDSFADKVPADDFADLLMLMGEVSTYFGKISKGINNVIKIPENASEEVKNTIQVKLYMALLIKFVKMIKDDDEIFRFVLDKLPYPEVEVV